MLNRLERELEIKVRQLHAELDPLERELADVRRAKSALALVSIPGSSLTSAMEPRSLADTPLVLQMSSESPFAKLTMMDLTLKALKEHFVNGATAQDLLVFFANAWGRRDVVRSSLSPQLSRLRAQGKIRREGLKWFLVDDGQKDEAPAEDKSEGASNEDGGGTPSRESDEDLKDRKDLKDLLS